MISRPILGRIRRRGEGYLGLARIRRHHRSPEYCLRLSIYNTNRMILEDIQRTTGGTMSVIGQRQAGWKVSYALIWTNAAAAKLIRKNQTISGRQVRTEQSTPSVRSTHPSRAQAARQGWSFVAFDSAGRPFPPSLLRSRETYESKGPRESAELPDEHGLT